MAGGCWLTLLTLFFLSAGKSLANIDQKWLTGVIENLKTVYELGDSYSLAANIPLNQNLNSLQQILQDDPADRVQGTLSDGRLYQGRRVVASAGLGALAKVLDHMEPLVKHSQGHFLVIYSAESPCGPTCLRNANKEGITAEINTVLQKWRGYAFAFSKVGNVPDSDATKLAEAFRRLAIAKLGLDNIFRCYGEEPFQCTSCSSGGDVAASCVSNQGQESEEDTSSVPAADTAEPAGQELGGLGGGFSEGLITGRGRGGRGGRRRERNGGGVGRCRGRSSRREGCKRGSKDGGRCKSKGGCKRKRGGRRGRGGRVRKQGEKRGRRTGRSRGRKNKGQRGGKRRRCTKSRGGKGRGRGRKSKGLK